MRSSDAAAAPVRGGVRKRRSAQAPASSGKSSAEAANRTFVLILGSDSVALMREPGAVISRDHLEDAVYGWGEEVGSNSIEVHLHHLRRKLEPGIIRNIRGVGYQIARIMLEGVDGSVTEYRFSQQKENVSVSDERFRFSPPPGVETIESDFGQ